MFCSEDLWASLSHVSSKPVAAVMETWTKQMGFPVLSVTAEQVWAILKLQHPPPPQAYPGHLTVHRAQGGGI